MNIAAFKVSHRWHLCREPGMPERGKRESSWSGRWQLQCDGAANQDCGRTRFFEPVCLTRRTPRLLDSFLCNICQSMCVDGMFHDLSCASIWCDDAFSPLLTSYQPSSFRTTCSLQNLSIRICIRNTPAIKDQQLTELAVSLFVFRRECLQNNRATSQILAVARVS